MVLFGFGRACAGDATDADADAGGEQHRRQGGGAGNLTGNNETAQQRHRGGSVSRWPSQREQFEAAVRQRQTVRAGVYYSRGSGFEWFNRYHDMAAEWAWLHRLAAAGIGVAIGDSCKRAGAKSHGAVEI